MKSSWHISSGKDVLSASDGNESSSRRFTVVTSLSVVLLIVILLGVPCGYSQETKGTVIVPLESTGIDESETARINSLFWQCMVETRQFDLIDRGAVDKILDEVKLGEQCGKAGCAAEIGSILRAESIIYGTIIKRNTTYTVNVKHDLMTGKNDRSALFETTCEDALEPYIRMAAREIAGLSVSDLYGNLAVDSSPEGAQVYEGRLMLGRTPLRLPDFTAGEHRLRAVLEGYEEWRGKIKVCPDTDTQLDIRLQDIRRRFSFGINGGLGASEYCKGDCCYDKELTSTIGGFVAFYLMEYVRLQSGLFYAHCKQNGDLVYTETGELSGEKYEVNAGYTNISVMLTASNSYRDFGRAYIGAGMYTGLHERGTAKIIKESGSEDKYKLDLERDAGFIAVVGLEVGGFGHGIPLFFVNMRGFWSTKTPMEGGTPQLGWSTTLSYLTKYKATGFWITIGMGY